MFGPAVTVVILLLAFVISGIKILKEYERGVIFRLGRLVASRGPGIIYVIPLIERMQKVELRTVTMAEGCAAPRRLQPGRSARSTSQAPSSHSASIAARSTATRLRQRSFNCSAELGMGV